MRTQHASRSDAGGAEAFDRLPVRLDTEARQRGSDGARRWIGRLGARQLRRTQAAARGLKLKR